MQFVLTPKQKPAVMLDAIQSVIGRPLALNFDYNLALKSRSIGSERE